MKKIISLILLMTITQAQAQIEPKAITDPYTDAIAIETPAMETQDFLLTETSKKEESTNICTPETQEEKVATLEQDAQDLQEDSEFIEVGLQENIEEPTTETTKVYSKKEL